MTQVADVQPDKLRPRATGLITIGCHTDNQGNSYLLDKLITTRYPLAVVLIELSTQLALRRMAMRAEWVPRMQNQEADALTNSEFAAFDPSLRIPVDLNKLDFKVMHRLLEKGEAYFEELQAAKERQKAEAARGVPPGKRRRGETLRERDPWPS